MYNLPNLKTDVINGWKIDWTKLYGELQQGEYKFILNEEWFSIIIEFSINENGEISYKEPSLM